MLTSSLPLTVQAIQALVARFTQSSRALRLHTPLGDDVLLAESLHGEEAIATGYRLRVSALSTDARLALKSLLGQPVLLELLAGPFQGVRPFHGHVTAAEMTGANGGLARYTLTIEPWTAFLALGRDSRVFQDKTIVDIIDTVFSAYDGKGRLAPAWRFQVDHSLYPRRSLTTQYQESDLAFVRRLMSEEGLFAFFEHEGDPDGATLGAHTLVIADSNDAFKPNTQALVRFTQSGAVMREDSIDRWRTEARLATNAVELRSWDYRARQVRAVGAAGQDPVELASRDIPGVYAYTSREHGARIAERQLQALEAGKVVHVGAGTVRTFTPGTTFTLADHAWGSAADAFLLVRVRHLAHNNLDADTASTLARHLGHDPVAALNDEILSASMHARGKRVAERPVYRNSFDAIPAATPYRDSQVDGHGRLLHPRPTVQGQQTAIVVGPPGTAIHTDRDHRIKVQFHWQRGAASHSRLDHPDAEGHTGAPADDRAGTWVRVATPLAPVAGANWGSHALPRVGQEVLIDFLDGNIDRPVVIGAVYNGAGAGDAQHNTVVGGPGAATGNAGAWFPGAAGAHAHAAVLSGLKSQAMQASGNGAGAYSQLVFDDTPGQARVALQRHAKAHRGTTELNLGHLVHQTDNQRLGAVGLGAELKTEHGATIRAGRGLLVATERSSAEGSALESGPAAAQIEQSRTLQHGLAETAGKHNARMAGETSSDKLPAIDALAKAAATLTTPSIDGAVTAYGQPQLQLYAPAGIAAATPASTVIASGTTTSITAGQDIGFASQGNIIHSVKAGVSLFTYGKATGNSKPSQETGIRMHAASGKVSTQSQSGQTRLTADKMITVASIAKSVNVAAKDHVLLTAQGAYIRLSGGDIELHGPGKIAFKASMKEFTGPQSATPSLPYMPHPANIENYLELNYRWDDMQPMVGAPYTVVFDNGVTRRGKLDKNGFAHLDNVPAIGATVMFGEDERDARPRRPWKPNALHGTRPSSAEHAEELLEQYFAQEDAHLKQNYFPDEIETMVVGSDHDYEFHYDDYLYEGEDTADSRQLVRTYRELHDDEHGDDARDGEEAQT
ncbi:type VI secretion system tip protein VgrG [Massilia sp. NEAU-DD11]|uniref:Type VI secretion system tip protein VgrG n=1 Tax=Massilia cellulosiltytica TaxID=2683234 RepID=A0A7X3FXL1_9BURK|nr:type VI secretion system Vgr family protein [Telluria cellulosilytica]MVW59665.1 type VI secretion system tip protein VgrG [Telluria cellulosilytica]